MPAGWHSRHGDFAFYLAGRAVDYADMVSRRNPDVEVVGVGFVGEGAYVFAFFKKGRDIGFWPPIERVDVV